MKQAEENDRLHQQLGRAQEAAKEGEKELVKHAEKPGCTSSSGELRRRQRKARRSS